MSTADEYIDKAKEYFDQENYEEALKNCNLAIGSKPDNFDFYYYRAVCYANMGRFRDAIPDFSKAIENSPDDAQCWEYRGDCYLEVGEYSKAISDYDKAIELESNNSRFYYNKAFCEYNLKKYDESLKNLIIAEEFDTDNSANYYSEKSDCQNNIIHHGKYLADYITYTSEYNAFTEGDINSIKQSISKNYNIPTNVETIYKEIIKALYKLYVDFVVDLDMADDDSVRNKYGEIVDLLYIKFYSLGRVSIYTGARNNTNIIPFIDVKQYIPLDFFDIQYEQLNISNDNKYKMIFDELMICNDNYINDYSYDRKNIEKVFVKAKDIISESFSDVQLMLDIERLFKKTLRNLDDKDYKNEEDNNYDIHRIYRDSKLDTVRCKIIENIENGSIKTIKDAERNSYLWLKEEEENNNNIDTLDDSEEQFKKYCNVAYSHLMSDECEKAIVNYKKALEIKYDSDIFETVADCYHELEQYEEEINHYESILSTKFVSWIYHRYENCYYEQQEYDKALEICTREIQEAPEAMKADAYCNRGKFKEKINDYKGALIDYKKALELDPESISVNRNIEKFKDWLEYWEIDTETMDEILSLLSSEKCSDVTE